MNNRYYDILDYSHIENRRFIRYLQVKYLKYGFWAENSISNMFMPNVLPQESDTKQVINTEPTLQERAKATADSHYSMVIRDANDCAVVQDIYLESIKNITELCNKRKWIPVLITMPYTKEYTESFPDSFIMQYKEDMKMLAKEYGVLYLDYSTDETYSLHPELFSDADHLSTGSLLFTEDIVNTLLEQGILEGKEG